ncbi:hypothetical protein ADUPG1_003837 [Aduncisulcus paluster]|uniref:Uncharacterized protein n=1 Tax=Aduncisulcus paluster TaxID=2918883 RepID=A0ABQ5L2I4_9EUKA|nr:hypothetical protein ADUPG1_003837 [Aduncisulcus paluster]
MSLWDSYEQFEKLQNLPQQGIPKPLWKPLYEKLQAMNFDEIDQYLGIEYVSCKSSASDKKEPAIVVKKDLSPATTPLLLSRNTLLFNYTPNFLSNIHSMLLGDPSTLISVANATGVLFTPSSIPPPELKTSLIGKKPNASRFAQGIEGDPKGSVTAHSIDTHALTFSDIMSGVGESMADECLYLDLRSKGIAGMPEMLISDLCRDVEYVDLSNNRFESLEEIAACVKGCVKLKVLACFNNPCMLGSPSSMNKSIDEIFLENSRHLWELLEEDRSKMSESIQCNSLVLVGTLMAPKLDNMTELKFLGREMAHGTLDLRYCGLDNTLPSILVPSEKISGSSDPRIEGFPEISTLILSGNALSETKTVIEQIKSSSILKSVSNLYVDPEMHEDFIDYLFIKREGAADSGVNGMNIFSLFPKIEQFNGIPISPSHFPLLINTSAGALITTPLPELAREVTDKCACMFSMVFLPKPSDSEDSKGKKIEYIPFVCVGEFHNALLKHTESKQGINLCSRHVFIRSKDDEFMCCPLQFDRFAMIRAVREDVVKYIAWMRGDCRDVLRLKYLPKIKKQAIVSQIPKILINPKIARHLRSVHVPAYDSDIGYDGISIATSSKQILDCAETVKSCLNIDIHTDPSECSILWPSTIIKNFTDPLKDFGIVLQEKVPVVGSDGKVVHELRNKIFTPMMSQFPNEFLLLPHVASVVMAELLHKRVVSQPYDQRSIPLLTPWVLPDHLSDMLSHCSDEDRFVMSSTSTSIPMERYSLSMAEASGYIERIAFDGTVSLGGIQKHESTYLSKSHVFGIGSPSSESDKTGYFIFDCAVATKGRSMHSTSIDGSVSSAIEKSFTIQSHICHTSVFEYLPDQDEFGMSLPQSDLRKNDGRRRVVNGDEREKLMKATSRALSECISKYFSLFGDLLDQERIDPLILKLCRGIYRCWIVFEVSDGMDGIIGKIIQFDTLPNLVDHFKTSKNQACVEIIKFWLN